ncbi:MAG: UUP1 family membrane protein [Rickettsiales bacterium]
MSRTAFAWMLFLLLSGAAAIIIWYKATRLSYPLMPNDTVQSWYVEAHAQLRSPSREERKHEKEDADAKALELSLVMPTDSDKFAVAGVQTVANGFGVQNFAKEGRHYRTFAKRNARETETVYLRFMLYELDDNAAPSEETIQRYARSEFSKGKRLANPDAHTQALYDTVDETIEAARNRSSGASSFLIEMTRYLENDLNKRDFLLEQTHSPDITALLVKLMRAAGYPARSANGLALEEQIQDAPILRWVEIIGDGKQKWRAFDPKTGRFDLQRDIYRWWIGDAPLYDAHNASAFSLSVFVKSNRDAAFTRAMWRTQEQQPWIYKLSPQSLPLDQQLLVQILLLLPIGGAFVAFFRQVIGFKTVGTFMPVLIALAFRETGALYGILFFGVLIMSGFVMRGYLDRLRLLLVPRLAAVLTFVILMIAYFMIASKNLGLPLGLSVALFPVVIITMFIERLSTMWEESGPKQAVSASIGTMSIAVIIYLLLINTYVRHFVFTFPESLLAVFGFCLILGRYNGYKVTEYYRFWQLRNAIKAERQKNADSGGA